MEESLGLIAYRKHRYILKQSITYADMIVSPNALALTIASQLMYLTNKRRSTSGQGG